MKQLTEKLKLNIDVSNLERGNFYLNKDLSIIYFEIKGGFFKGEEGKVFIKTIFKLMKNKFINTKYFGLKLEKLTEKQKLEILKILIDENFSNVSVEFGDKIMFETESPNKKFLFVVLKDLATNLEVAEKAIVMKDDKTDFSLRDFRNTKKVPFENMREVKLEKLPITEKEILEMVEEDIKVEGKIFKIETKNIRQKVLHSFYITNELESVIVKYFDLKELPYKIGETLVAFGKMGYDEFSNCVILKAINVYNVAEVKLDIKEDVSNIKRAELCVHSEYDTMDSLVSVDKYYQNASKFGIEALAILDKENVENFFEVENASKKYSVKPIYGTTFKVLDDENFKVYYGNKTNQKNVVGLDIETTGLSPLFDDIIEISAYKIVDNSILEYSVLVKTEDEKNEISSYTEELTSITKAMLDEKGVSIKKALDGLLDFIGDFVVVAHNAAFDINFLEAKIKKHLKKDVTFNFIDTLNFSRCLLRLKNYRLDTVAKSLDITLEKHHRAIYDAKCCLEIFDRLLGLVSREEVITNQEENCYAEIKTSTIKALEIIDNLDFNKIKIEKVEGLKNSYISFFDLKGSEVEKFKEKINEIKSTNILTIYKEHQHYFNYQNLNELVKEDDILNFDRYKTMTCLIKNQEGLKELYQMISFSHTKRITRRGVILFKSDLRKFKTDNLILGSSGRSGFFESVYYNGIKKIDINLYDYFEVNPISSFFSVDDGITEEKIKYILKMIEKIANKAQKPIIMASGSHYLDKKEKVMYEILNKTDFVGGIPHKYKNSKRQSDLHLYKTEELLNEAKTIYENYLDVVINNPKEIVDSISNDIKITPDKLYAPTETFLDGKKLDVLEGRNISNIKDEFMSIIDNSLKFYEVDGNLAKYVKERVEKEENSITKHGFHIIYYISYLLVKKSNQDGYVVGSRGSVGSSFVARLMGITEVNALKPHYICPNCHFQIYKGEKDSFPKCDNINHLVKNLDGVSSGFDLKDEVCPICGKKLIKDGHDIPFETFLGFDGDKVPDIDLNFASVYQSRAHLFTKELFGKKNVVRAGTISKFAEKTAFNTTREYFDKLGKRVSDAECLRLSDSLLDIKRTTGQHASGIIVIPEGKIYEDFFPIQYPANDKEAWLTTHFEYSNIHDNLLKLDILGHIDPTMLKALMNEVNKNPQDFPFSKVEEIPFCDKKIFDLLRKDNKDIIRALGISEFGTKFVMGMLSKIKIENFSDLVKVSGLSHGTDVWQNNGEDLVTGATRFGEIPFNKIIGCRDDIMVELLKYGLKPKLAFDIMEFIRKGKLHKGGEAKWEEYKKEMTEKNVPDWYIWSLSKIKYMFPKAHAIAYVMSALRIAWFKAYKPSLFYRVFLSIRDKKFDTATITTNERSVILGKIKEIENNKNAKLVEKSKIPALEMALEMLDLGIKILPPSINKSDATNFIEIKENMLLTPFNMIDGVGDEIAKTVFENRKEGYTSLEDLKKRGKANKKFIDGMEELGCLKF